MLCDNDNCYHLGGAEYSGITAEDVLTRMLKATGTTALVELAGWLGVRQALLSDVRRTGRIPMAWLRLISNNVLYYSQEWILTGKNNTSGTR